MGTSLPLSTTESELKKKLAWDDAAVDTNNMLLETIKLELTETSGILIQQFGKIATIIAFLGLLIAFGLRGDTGTKPTIITAFLAAGFALWAQSPRLKVIFRFHTRERASERAVRLKSQWDLYWYYYQWLERRESTTNAIEMLVIVSTTIVLVAIAVTIFSL
jgi:hypothetical protein